MSTESLSALVCQHYRREYRRTTSRRRALDGTAHINKERSRTLEDILIIDPEDYNPRIRDS